MEKLFKVLLGVAVLVAACSPDGARDPLGVKPSFEDQSNPPPDDCDPNGDPRPECDWVPPPPPPGYMTYEPWFDEREVDISFSASSYEEDPESAPCPRSLTGFLPSAWARDPNTGYQYTFPSSGTWIINWVKSLPYLSSGQAIYSWPQGGGDGSWPAYNQSLGAGGAKIWVREGRAVCLTPPGNVIFVMAYGVRVEDPNVRRPGSGGGGGGGSEDTGGGSDCTQEYVYLEVDYGDGTGWHTLWEGYARVCG
jgi:hypothetical protein